MIDFGWVRIYLGDVFLENMCFIVFLLRFVEKGPKTANYGQCRGPFAAAKRPLTATKVLTAEKDPHGAARLRRRIFPSPGSPR